MQRSILIVDDDADVLVAIRTVLESEDHVVYSAVNLEQAKARMWESDVDVVIMDYVFGECTGDQLVRELRKVDEGFSVIFLSGWPQVIKAVEGLEFEVYRVFLKPVDPEILLSAVESLGGGVDPYECLDARRIVSELRSSF